MALEVLIVINVAPTVPFCSLRGIILKFVVEAAVVITEQATEMKYSGAYCSCDFDSKYRESRP